MTQDKIIEMAKQAGLHIATDVKWMPIIGLEYAEKFAKLVREDALAQPAPVQEPVACVGPWHDARLTLIPRYSHQTFEHNQPLYATPQKREFVKLTDEEIWKTISRIGTSDSDVNPYAKLSDARAIEAKLKELNT